jgi:nitrogenase molybdenum-iron protein beta chain
MSQTQDAKRQGCALHGVIKLLDAIAGVVPIVHANAGCSLNAHFNANLPYSANPQAFRSIQETSATTLQDKHVVFGGTARLREQIKNTLKVLQGDLYVVASGCVPEIIGDDLPAMVKEAREQQFPVLGISAPGFKGNAYTGYANALKSLLIGIDSLYPDTTTAREPLRVNLFGLLPDQDPFWEADLLELERLLAAVGIQANRLMGMGQTIDAWKTARHASLSLVLSPWGSQAADYLNSQHGVATLNLGWLPVGSQDCLWLLEQLATLLPVSPEQLAEAKQVLAYPLRYFLQKISTLWLQHDLQKTAAIIAPAAYAVGLARFLAGTMGLPIAQVIISDDPDELWHTPLRQAIEQISPDAQVLFGDEKQQLTQLWRDNPAQVLFASHLEQDLATQFTIPLLEIASPLRQRLILTRGYGGILGALALVEDVSSILLAHQQKHTNPPPQYRATQQYADVRPAPAKVMTQPEASLSQG